MPKYVAQASQTIFDCRPTLRGVQPHADIQIEDSSSKLSVGTAEGARVGLDVGVVVGVGVGPTLGAAVDIVIGATVGEAVGVR